MPASGYGEVGPFDIRPAAESPAAQGAANMLAPLALCVGAGLALAVTPVLVWRLVTGDWVCLNDWFSLYYLRFVAQAYYNCVPYISDVVVPGGVTGYPWLPFVPATYLARALAAGPFAVNLIWIFLSAIALSAGLYFVFRHFLKRPWAAAGCTIFCLSDYGFAAARPLVTQLQMLASALWLHPKGLVVIPWGLLLQWRVPDPGLDLPFMCFQIVALARARKKPTRLNIWLSGLAFGFLFYIFFYCWTMAMAGLSIAFLLDRAGRKVYGVTLCIGSVIGLPQLIYSVHLNHLASAEAMRRFGLFTPAPRFSEITVPTLSLLVMAAIALWIWRSRRFDLVYVWSLVAGGILLSRSRAVSGIFFHEYHYNWLWTPIRLALVLIVAVSIVSARFRWRPVAASICWVALMLYFASGAYLSAICVTRTWSGADEVRNYTRYKSQRFGAAIKPLVAGATVAGDDGFCELAAVAEDQLVLSGEAVPRSMAVDNEQWELRAALNAYLVGTDRETFEKAARLATRLWFWESPEREPEVIAAFMRKYDDVIQDPDRFIAEFRVRYVALSADKAQMAYLREGWTMLQRGPYWQIWEKAKIDSGSR
ncbi:MAG: hypothetical protein ACREPW_08480 [Candidatus Binataceae bacterium]